MTQAHTPTRRLSPAAGRRQLAAVVSSAMIGLIPTALAAGPADAAPATVAAPAQQAYTVVRGDTLTRIATRFHTTVNALVALNHLANANSLAVGQRLLVPSTTSTPSPATGVVTTSFGARLDPHKCAASSQYWKGQRRFFLNTHADDGCFRSVWFGGVHPIMLSYGPTIAPWYPGVNYHHGIDIDMAVGTPVYAGVAGTVHVRPAVIGPAYGTNRMLVRAGRTDYVLGHMSRLVVREGQQVRAGQLLGYSGMSGVENEDGPHLHFQVEPAGTSYLHSVDPHSALKASRV